MPEIKTNEREFENQLISWFNEILRIGCHEAKEATGETSVKDTITQFPDIVLWKSREEKKAIASIELKNTTVPIDDAELLENGMQKAINLSCKYLITWNVRETAIWDISKGRPDRIHKYPVIISIRTIQDILRPDAQNALKARAREIIEDLDTHIVTGVFRARTLDAVLFAGVLQDTVEHLNPEFKKALITKYSTDKTFQKAIQKWARRQGIQNYDTDDFFTSISKQIVYRIIGQVLFYFALKRHNGNLPNLEINDFEIEKAKDVLQAAFEEVRKIDYQAIYEKDLIDEIDWNTDAAITLQNLLKSLAFYDFSSMPLDVIGEVFEKLIPPNEQHVLGQYFTPVDLVDLINGFVLRTANDEVFDPTCGTGTFLVRGYNRFQELYRAKSHEDIIKRIWGNDISPFPAELSAINLFVRRLDDANNYPRIIAKDFLEINPGDKVEFPHPRLGIKSPFKMEIPVPTFDGMMGNFPYIRQELIEKAFAGYKKKISELIASEWLAEYPELFDIPKAFADDYQRWIESGHDPKKEGKLFEVVDIKLSGQADIYAYMFFHAAKFLKLGGRMAFLTSNSWLDVAYGYELQRFFTKKFKIIAILESRCEPWFHTASVNTIITVLERCDDEEEAKNHNARFVKINKKLEDLLPQEDLNLQGQQRHLNVDRLVNLIEDDDLRGKEISPGLFSYEDKNFRIRTVKQGDLAEELENANETVKWGKFLRAPDVYFELMDAIGDKLVPLSQVADVRFGIKTGINEFFYLTPERAKLYGIEEQYLVPVVKSPKEIDGLVVDPEKLKFRLFMCNKSKDELRAAGHMGALRYIEQVGEKGATKAGVKWPDVPSVKGRKYWWGVGERTKPDFVWFKAFGDRFHTPFIENHDYVSDRMFEISMLSAENKNGVLFSLNSAYVNLYLEVNGRVNLGDGALDNMVYEAQAVKIPNPGLIKIQRTEFESILKRPVRSIFKEVKQPDRREMDAAILKALGLNPDEWLDRIYDGLTELVRERIDLPKMRKKEKKARVVRSVEGVVEELVKNYQGRLRKFPDDFVDLSNWEYIDLPQGQFERCVTNGMMSYCEAPFQGKMWKYEFPSDEIALYAYYGQHPELYLLKRPKSDRELVNAVYKYQRWMRELYDGIFHDAVGRVLSPGESENIAREVMSKLGLKRE